MKSSEKKTQNMDPKSILLIQFVSIVIIDSLIALLVFLLAKVVCGKALDLELYFKLFFIPLISFITGFISLAFTRNLLLSVVGNVLLGFVLFLISNGFNASVFLWILLYMVNAALGYVAAFAARSYRA